VSQLAGCNSLHEAEERLALAAHGAGSRSVGCAELYPGVSGHDAGSRRTTVTLIAGALQRADLIEYSRGKVRIPNRERLETAACECYRITKNLFTNLYANAAAEPSSNGLAAVHPSISQQTGSLGF